MVDEANSAEMLAAQQEPKPVAKPNPFSDPPTQGPTDSSEENKIAPNYVQRVQTVSPEKKCFVKIVAIGDSGVGKTSLIQMFEHSRFTENFKPTIGADFSNKEITIDNKVVTLQIWDTAG